VNRKDFKEYKNKFVQAASQVLAEDHAENLNESGFPAYSNPNPLMNFLFWERISHAMREIEKKGRLNKVLDFGCGSGVMLPFLAERVEHIVAVDVDLEPLRRIEKHVSFAEHIHFTDTHKHVEKGSLDLITALDVLEHVNDLETIVSELASLLKPGGEIIVSGPTENIFYQVGRLLAGPTYSGHYHVRDIYDIENSVQKYFDVQRIKTLYVPVPLFVIFKGRVKR